MSQSAVRPRLTATAPDTVDPERHSEPVSAATAGPPADSNGPLYAELERISTRLQSMKCTLEPPRNAVQQRRCNTAPSLARGSFGERDVNAILSRLRSLAETSSPADRSRVNELISWAEITIANHFRTLLGKTDPARRSVEAARRAVVDDPRSPTASSLYAQIMVGLRSSTWRSVAERVWKR